MIYVIYFAFVSLKNPIDISYFDILKVPPGPNTYIPDFRQVQFFLWPSYKPLTQLNSNNTNKLL